MKSGLVIMPLVATVLAGLCMPAAAQQNPPLSANPGAADPTRPSRLQEAAAKPTPRAADGHPDLTGFWADPPREASVVLSTDGKTLTVLDRDAPELDARAQPNFKARAADISRRPQYKKEFQARQRELMFTASHVDPGIHCYPQGVPRIGAPTEIVQTPNIMYFLYGSEGGADQTHSTTRIARRAGEHVIPDYACVERDREHKVNNDRP